MKQIIIAGASRGIGLAVVKLLSQQGHNILALSRNIGDLTALKLRGVEVLACDITNERHQKEVGEYLHQNKWEVDVLINNAGAIVNKPFSQLKIREFKEIYDTNVFGVVGLIQAVLPYIRSAGHVLNISSMGGVQGSAKFPGLSAYSSSKGALITLTELLAEEYKDTGPRFNVLALGAVQTEMLEEAFPGYKAPVSASDMAEYISDFCLNGHKYFNGKILQVANSTP